MEGEGDISSPSSSSQSSLGRGFFARLFSRDARSQQEAIEDEYNAALKAGMQEDWEDLDALEFLRTDLLDKHGRPVVVVTAKNFPAKVVKLERLQRYLICKLHALADDPYVIIWLHTQATYSSNCPSVRWLWRTYERLPERFRTNMARMYLVHCDLALWAGAALLLPWFTGSAWRKVEWVQRVEFLEEALTKRQLAALLPDFVVEHDELLEDQPLMDYGVVASKEASMVPGMPAPL